jgi:hypothetical protein
VTVNLITLEFNIEEFRDAVPIRLSDILHNLVSFSIVPKDTPDHIVGNRVCDKYKGDRIWRILTEI